MMSSSTTWGRRAGTAGVSACRAASWRGHTKLRARAASLAGRAGRQASSWAGPAMMRRVRGAGAPGSHLLGDGCLVRHGQRLLKRLPLHLLLRLHQLQPGCQTGGCTALSLPCSPQQQGGQRGSAPQPLCASAPSRAARRAFCGPPVSILYPACPQAHAPPFPEPGCGQLPRGAQAAGQKSACRQPSRHSVLPQKSRALPAEGRLPPCAPPCAAGRGRRAPAGWRRGSRAQRP